MSPRTEAIFDLKPVSEVPPLIQKGRTSKYSLMLDEIKAQPGQTFEVATYKSAQGAANTRNSLRSQYDGYTFEARKVNAEERGGPAGETWSVLYARFNG